ncbi:MAG: hypothetical protein AB8G11_09040 [Saprospiraceae bacterium]
MKLFYSLLFVLFILTIGCNRDCEYTEQVAITAKMPDTINVNQSVQFNLDYGTNGCGGTPHLDENINGNNRKLILEIDVISPDCACTEQYIFQQYPYSFIPTTAGIYTFELSQPNGNNLLDTIIVQ